MRVIANLGILLANKQVSHCSTRLASCLPKRFTAAGQKVMNEVATVHNAPVRLSHRDVSRIFRLQVTKEA